MAAIRWTGGSMEAAIQQVVFPQVRDNVAARLRAVRCPEHGIGPKSVILGGRDIDSLTWEVRGCCGKLVEAAKAALE